MINRLGRIKNDLVYIMTIFVMVFTVRVFAAELVRQKGIATTFVFPITNSSGDYVSGATSFDSEYTYWEDGGTPGNFADLSGEASEIGTSGWAKLSINAVEMNHGYIAFQVKSSELTQGGLVRTIIGDPLNLATTDDGGTINVTSGKVDEVATLTGHTAQTGDNYARLGAPAGASVSADIAAVKSETAAILTDTSAVDTTAEMRAFLYGSDTPGATAANQTTIIGYVDDLETRLTATRAGYLDYINTIYGKLPTNYLMGSSVVTDKDDEIDAILQDTGTTLDGKVNVIDSIIDDILTDTGTTIPAAIAALDSKADVIDGIIDSILEDTGTTLPGTLASISTNLDEVLADTGTTLPASLSGLDSKSDTIDAVVDAILVDTGTDIPAAFSGIDSKIDTAQADISDILTDTGTTLPATLASIDSKIDSINISAADIWDYNISGYVDAGKAGTYLKGAGSAGDPWVTSLPGSYTSGQAGYIIGTNLDALISSRLAAAGYTAPDNSSITAILEDTGTTLPGYLSNLDSKIDTAQADLDTPNQYKADVSGLATSANLATTDGKVDSILEDTGTTLPGSLSNLSTKIDTAQADLDNPSQYKADVTNLDAAVSSRLATAGYTAPDNASITAILEDTGTTLPGSLSNLSTKIDTAQADLDNPAQYKATGFSTHSAADVWAVDSKTITGLTAAALADFFDTDSGTNYASAAAGSVVKEIADNAGGSSLSEEGIADAVWDELQAGHTTEGSFGYYLDSPISGVTASISDADIDKIWDELLSGHATAGSTGKYLSDIYDATDGNKEGASYTGIETLIRTSR